jgi:hypothetical protein
MRPGTQHDHTSPYATKADVAEIVTEAFEKFAIIMKRSFDDVYMRFDMVDARFDGVDARMNAFVENEFLPFKRNTEQSFYEIKTDIGHIKVRLGKVEGGLIVTNAKLDGVIDVVRDHEMRITHLERNPA